MDELVGQSLGHYRIDSRLGGGGMGTVYKATDVTLRRPVAIKMMHAHLSQQGDFQKRFLNEARAAAQLDHPGIVKVYDFGEAQSLLYIVMEFLPGDNLRQMLENLRAKGQWIVLSEAVPLIRQVCLAVDYAHRKGVLHRDLKPDNIMLKTESADRLPYRPVLTDLGLARLVSAEHLTQTGVSMGTPAYMSPEQALGEETDARSDVYSLGVLLYQLAVGRLPFPIQTITEAIRHHAKEPAPALPPPRSVRAEVPEALERVILRALERDPAARFPTAAALAEALNAIPLQATTAATTAAATLAGAAPTTAGASLLTVHQASMTGVRGPSVLGEFPALDSAVRQDRISILAPDHTIRSVLMKPQGLTIGRGAGNDVVLNDDQVSRRHARVTFDGTNYQVTDLHSSNGTYLANFKLLPGIAQVWTPDKPLRVGGHYLRLERSQPAAESTRGSVTSQKGTRVGTSTGQGRVGVFMEMTEFTVAPGSNVALPLTIINQGEVVDHFGVSVEGVPKEWLPGPAPLVQLLPGLQQQVMTTIQPPRTSQSRADAYPLRIRVMSQNAPGEFTEVNAKLTVQVYHQLNSRLMPEKIRSGKLAQVSVRNQGNTPESLNLMWRDQADELNFAPPQTKLTVPEGQESAVSFTAQPKHRRWIGGEKQHPFAVQVTSSAGEAQPQSGQVVSYGLIPAWLPPLVMLVLLAVCGLVYAWVARPPGILSFTYDPPNPIAGQPVTVRWRVEGAQTVELRPLLSSLPDQGEYTFERGFDSPPELTLVATNLFGSSERRLVLVVANLTPTPTPEPGAPVIEEWSVSPVKVNEGETVTIKWTVSNAESVQLKLGDAVNTVDSSGMMVDSPSQNRVYTLIANHKAAGKPPVQRSQEVYVVPATPTPDVGATAAANATQGVAAQQTQQAIAATETWVAQQAEQARAATQTVAARQTQESRSATLTAQAVPVDLGKIRITPLTGIVVITPCGGARLGGYCWYLGADSASCDTVCAPHGGYSEATKSYAGSDGSADNCRSVLSALSISFSNFFNTSQGGIGCFIIPNTSGSFFGYWDQQPTTASATYSTPGRRRACACQR